MISIIKNTIKPFFFSIIKIQKNKERRAFEKLCALIDTDVNRKDGLFDADWYAKTYPDIIFEGQTEIYHYLHRGYKEGRDPGPNFDTQFYLKAYPDVRVSGLNPLLHYILHGHAEGRQCNRAGSRQAGHPNGLRHVIVKELTLAPGDNAAILVTHAPAGRLKPHILPYVEQLSGTGLSVLLFAIASHPLELLDNELDAAAGLIVRNKAGSDFAVWAHAFQLCPALYGAGLLVMTNDSVLPTSDTQVFRAMMDRVGTCWADIAALTAGNEHSWHVRSSFLALKPKALSSWTFQHLMRDMPLIDDEDRMIRTLEVPFASRMQAAGLTVEVIYKSAYSANSTFLSWRELIAEGFPFVELLILRKQIAVVADQPKVREVHETWPKVLEEAGFDIDLVRATLRAAERLQPPVCSDEALLIDEHRYDAISTDHQLKIAYFGPWNYDSGLGAASREMLCALRHTDAQMNCYPVMKPFHVHQLICPAVATLDFQGRPDIAIVHLNPDSWNVLTEEQWRIIRSAKMRIGYWVWETDTIPEGWQRDLNSVDRIWAPSTYCANIFATQVCVPVDVVHHPVRIPARVGADRESVLRRFGVDPTNRVILYIFDGASYIVRKNPEALIRAFAASGLAAQGWVLLLKAKHLHDRPDVGRALTDLADGTVGVLIVEVSLYADEVISLLAAADIYASPHCSEGFGLTVAEAMAVGVPVVVTDFAGTCDFVDATSGYPVAAKPWILEQNHGHYQAGHGWAKIDEDELATTLSKVAQLVDAGGDTVASAGRARIADLLSYETVAKAIHASFSDLIDESGSRVSTPTSRVPFIMPTLPEIDISLNHARKFAGFTGQDGIVPVAVNDDLSWSGNAIPDGRPDDWLIFAPGSSRISPEAIHLILAASTKRPDVVLLYADDVATAGNALDRVRLKPDFNRTMLAAQDYIGAPVMLRRKAYYDVGGLNSARGTAALYDLVLKVAEVGGAITRIPEVLIGFNGTRPFAGTADRRAALAARKEFSQVDMFDSIDVPGLLVQRGRFTVGDYPAVTLAIPTRRTLRPGSRQSYVEHLLEQLAEADWPMDRMTVIVGDDIAGDPEWNKRTWPFKLTRIETLRAPQERFNYSVKMNHLWREARDELIVFLNDDSIPCDTGWLKALVGFAVDRSVGGVGARLYYEDGSIQHAGMFPTLRTIAHAWRGWPAHAKTYQDWASTQREWSAVTGAIFATRRSILEQVNGFEERFSLEFNDVDLCLRIRNLGYRIVYNPDAQFIHTEKASRGRSNPPGEEVALFLSRWSCWLDHDPASHPALSRSRMDLVAEPEEGAWYRR